MAVGTTAIALVLLTGSGVAAQTLADPHAQQQPSPPPLKSQSQPNRPVKSCSAFGPGFVNVPGTDACVKVGGSVTVEGTGRR